MSSAPSVPSLLVSTVKFGMESRSRRRTSLSQEDLSSEGRRRFSRVNSFEAKQGLDAPKSPRVSLRRNTNMSEPQIVPKVPQSKESENKENEKNEEKEVQEKHVQNSVKIPTFAPLQQLNSSILTHQARADDDVVVDVMQLRNEVQKIEAAAAATRAQSPTAGTTSRLSTFRGPASLHTMSPKKSRPQMVYPQRNGQRIAGFTAQRKGAQK